MLQFPIAMTPRTEPARALAWLSPVIAFALTVLRAFVFLPHWVRIP